MRALDLTLLTDLYELTMMQGYFKNPTDQVVVFDAFYRQNPCDGGYAIAAGLEQIIDYIYDHYDHFRLLLKCGNSGKYEAFIHNMVEREIKSGEIYIEKMRAIGINVPQVSESLIHMIYTGFFSSVFQIIEHDIDRETAKENVHQLREFNTGGWERLWGIKFPAENHAMPGCDTLEKE